MKKHAPLLALLTLAACGAPPEPATPPTPTTAAASASAAPSAGAEAAPPPAAPAPFSVVVELPASATFHRVDGGLVVVGSTLGLPEALAPWYGADPPKAQEEGRPAFPIGVLEGGKVRFPKPALFSTVFDRVHGIAGRWPDGLYLLTTGDTGRTGVAILYALTDRGWVQRGGDEGYHFVGAATSGGRPFAMRAPVMAWPGSKASIVALDRGPVPYKLTPTTKKDCWSEQFGAIRQTVAVMPQAFAGTSEGTLVSAGWNCRDQLAAEVWRPGARASEIHAFEGHEADMSSNGPLVVPGPAKDLWLLDKFVARWDGDGWKDLGPSPGDRQPRAAAGAADGSLWIIDDAGALHHLTGAKWEQVPLPPGLRADDVAFHEGALLVAADGVILRHGAPGAPPAPRADKPAAGAKPPVHRLPRAGGPRCPHNLVLLYAFTKMTPDDYDFPLTRKAVKGHAELAGVRFVVTRDFGQKFFAAQVPSFDAGKKLLSLIEKEVKGSKPQLLCAEPEVLREVKIDLRTGEVQK